MRLKKRFKKKWVAALRSGKYKQARGALSSYVADTSNPDGYCCLGVAACVLADEGRGRWEDRYFYFPASSDQDYGYDRLPVPAREAIGLECNVQSLLISLNDSNKMSFEEIADYIEKNL